MIHISWVFLHWIDSYTFLEILYPLLFYREWLPVTERTSPEIYDPDYNNRYMNYFSYTCNSLNPESVNKTDPCKSMQNIFYKMHGLNKLTGSLYRFFSAFYCSLEVSPSI
jgi:hypothetical protein